MRPGFGIGRPFGFGPALARNPRSAAVGDQLATAFATLEAAGKLVSAWFLPLADPAQYLTLDGSNNVGTWTAAYGTQKVDLSEATNKPVYDSTLFGGKGGVTFNGTNQCLTGTGNVTNWPDATSDLYMIMAGRNDLAGGTAGAIRGFSYGDGSTNSSRYVGRIASGGENRALLSVAATTAVGNTNMGATPHTIGAFMDVGGTTRLYLDGVSDGTVSTATAALTLTRVRIGASANTTASAFWSGPISSFAVLGPTASTADFLALELLMRMRLRLS